MKRSRRSATARSGFTLVELLVAAALCILIMTILATAFQSGLDTLSHLKSAATLSEQLRTAEIVLRRDLSAVHLEDELGRPVRLSTMPTPQWRSQPNLPRKGYFSIKQPSPVQPVNPTNPAMANYPFLLEGIEDGIESFRATDHTISMTIKLSGKGIQDVVASEIPITIPPPLQQLIGQPPFSRLDLDPTTGRQLVSQWAEVVWFLRPINDPATGLTSELTDPNDPTFAPRPKLQLYSLHRMQRVISPLPVDLPLSGTPFNFLREQYPELSIASVRPVGATAAQANYPQGYQGTSAPTVSTVQVNTPESVTDPLNRTEYIVDWANYTGSGPPDTSYVSTPPRTPIPLLPAGYALTRPVNNLPLPGNASKLGSDLVLNNVISMEVKVFTDLGNAGVVPRHLPPYAAPGNLPRVYDTYYGGTVGGQIINGLTPHRLRAVQLKFRIYDAKNNMTRQMTLTQDL